MILMGKNTNNNVRNLIKKIYIYIQRSISLVCITWVSKGKIVEDCGHDCLRKCSECLDDFLFVR